MKKVLLTIAAVAFITVANAQIKTNAGTFNKPVKGDILTEFTFTPNFSGESQFTSNGIKLRKFISDDRATRYAINLGFANEAFGDEEKMGGFDFSISLGRENHLKGAERLSTFWGYEGLIGFGSVSSKEKVNNNWRDVDKMNTFSVGARTFAGADYYFIPNVYLGAEISYGLVTSSEKNTQYEYNPNKTITEKQNSLVLGSSITSFLRLGWKF
jgi:hypothetical protein